MYLCVCVVHDQIPHRHVSCHVSIYASVSEFVVCEQIHINLTLVMSVFVFSDTYAIQLIILVRKPFVVQCNLNFTAPRVYICTLCDD